MAKDINLTSQQWNDIIFEGKNKDYGAYEMRQSSSKRHIVALLSIFVLALFVAVLPVLADKVAALVKPDNLNEEIVLKNVGVDKLEEEKQEILEELSIPEPLMSTIAYAPPEIVDQSEINDDNELRAVEDIAESKLRISVATVEGNTEEGGVDIADLLKQQQIAGEAEKKVYDVVEILPEFPGGEGELYKYLQSNIVYPPQAREIGIQGQVKLRFVVNRNGSISEITVQRSPNKLLSDEAIRVIKEMPKWVPGKQNGKAVNVYFILPVDFKLN